MVERLAGARWGPGVGGKGEELEGGVAAAVESVRAAGREAAVDEELGAVDVRRVVRGEEGHGGRHLLGSSLAFGGGEEVPPGERVGAAALLAPGHGRVDQAEHDGVGPDAAAGVAGRDVPADGPDRKSTPLNYSQ